MRWIWTILLIGSYLSLPSHASSEFLYLYGEPYYTPSTGLVRVDPSDFSAHPTAQGFATNTNLNLVTGLELNQDGTQGILFGNFQFWNKTYVGSVLQLNPQTLNVSTFGSGVLGQAIACATFISDTQIAIGGEFTGFTHAPQLQLTQVGVCNNRGENCYTLTSVPVKSGPKDLFYLNGYLYASFLPNVAPPSIQIWRYNFDSGNPNQEWVEILNQQADVRSVMTVFNGSIWLFGSMTIQNIAYGAMQYEPNSNSWAAYNANPPYNLTNTELSVLVSVSPDNQTAFLSVVSDSFAIYKWNNPAKSWSNWTNVECPSFTTALSFAAFTNGMIVPCNGTLMKLSEQNISDIGIVVVQQSLGYFYCKDSVLATTPNQNSIIAYCSQPESGKFATYDVSTASLAQCCGTLADLSQLVVTMDAMCVYGSKVFLSGQFQAIDSVPSNYTMSVWYQQYERWYSIDLPGNTSIANCYCDTDGDMMVAVCRPKNAEKNLPFMVIDHAANEVNALTIVMLTDTQGYDKVSAVQIYDSQIFFAAGAARENSVAIFSWSEIFGSIPAIVADGESINSMLFVDEVLFMGGSLVTAGNKTLSFAAYNTTSNLFIEMDPILVTSTIRGVVHSLTYSPYTNLIYVAGEFTQAGPLRVQNIVGYSLNGTAVDTLAGGLPGEVTSIVSIDNGIFAVYLQDCPQNLDPNCGALVFFNFDEQVWSYTLALGAGYISQGPNIGGSGKDEIQYIEKIIISSCVLLGVAIVALAVVWLVKRKKSKSGVQYKEIPASLEDPEIASRASIDLIDFDHEPFDPQEVIGKGTFGTVWTCEFPQRGPALFAVKQILLSKGEVKKIETVEQELETLKMLRHPHIANLLGSRKENSTTSVEFFLFMELYEYPASMKELILMKKKNAESSGNYEWFSYAEVAKFLKQISEGLCYLHHQGIAHRDLKPSNILIRVEGKSNSVRSLHLSDFGLARAIEENNNKLAAAMISNSTCMAPEIFQQDNYDAFKADIWSFGIVLFEILTWEEPTTPGFRPSFPETQNNNNEFAQIVEIFNECTEADAKKRPTCDELYHLCSTL